MPIIQISKGKEAVVSEEDHLAVSQWKWTSHSGGYSYRNQRVEGRCTTVYMHRFIMERMLGSPIPDGYEVDHQDADKLNNQRENLRLVTPHQNMMNRQGWATSSSRFRGVSRVRNKWRCTIHSNGKHVHLGYFEDEEEAARAYDEAAIRERGEFARLNFPEG